MSSQIKDSKDKIHKVFQSNNDKVRLFKIIRDISNCIRLIQEKDTSICDMPIDCILYIIQWLNLKDYIIFKCVNIFLYGIDCDNLLLRKYNHKYNFMMILNDLNFIKSNCLHFDENVKQYFMNYYYVDKIMGPYNIIGIMFSIYKQYKMDVSYEALIRTNGYEQYCKMLYTWEYMGNDKLFLKFLKMYNIIHFIKGYIYFPQFHFGLLLHNIAYFLQNGIQMVSYGEHGQWFDLNENYAPLDFNAMGGLFIINKNLLNDNNFGKINLYDKTHKLIDQLSFNFIILLSKPYLQYEYGESKDIFLDDILSQKGGIHSMNFKDKTKYT